MQHRQLSKQLLEYFKVVRAHRHMYVHDMYICIDIQMNSIVEQFAIN